MIKAIAQKLNGFFINGHERTLKAKKNVFLSLILKGITIAISLVMIPLTISYVNATQYGIWLTLSSIVGWFNFFDIGLGHGLKNKLAEANALGNIVNSRTYISTTYVIITIIVSVVFVLFFIANFFIDWGKVLNSAIVPPTELNTIVIIIFASFCVQLILQILSSVLTALHAIAKISVINAIGQLGCLISIYILTKRTEGSLLNLVMALTLIPIVVQVIATIYYFNVRYVELKPSLKLVDFKFAKSLLSLGGAFFFVQIGGLLLFQTDNIVVTQLFGPHEVTIFNISYKLFSIINLIFTIIMNPFWPAFTDAYAKNDTDWIKSVFKKMYKYFFGLSIIAFILLLVSPFVFKIWLGKNIAVPFPLSLTMTVYVICICWMTIPCFLVNGIGKIRLQIYLYIISSAINIPLAILWGKWFGLIGVTISNILVLIMMSIVLSIQCKKILNNNAYGIWDM
ncbi:oligosaccharide flippase family protein [Mucilaginibacter sp. cycad4]|uniref:lipopolysaccharide biosynthesis protein n=1 Tax=Mucilaginibacter sp. cycad4 TaxID=3342096 RepID=UPI002AABE2F5|nr:oligosaccharide flippase family protein [Mucilaginibacter gossypii]WPV02342.1 oligosaccharide flippase family protein [Mucilaginibacter gossypii]